MKLVKGLQKWIEGYNDVKTLTDELELAFDFYKDELVTEQEVDEAYAKALEHVENLELQNMLRDEADQMSCVLKINSGAGGTESQDWASMLMRMYLRYAETNGYKATMANLQEGEKINLLEVNTTPGMTATSFIPQQVRAAGLDIKDVMTDIIENKF